MINELKEKIELKYVFLIGMILIYLIIFFFNQKLFNLALKKSVSIFLSILPSLVFVFILTFVFNFLINPRKMTSFLKKNGVVGTIFAIVSGIISTGPIYLWYPLLGDLQEKGVKNYFIAIFLYNRAIKLPLLPLFVSYFGLGYAIVLTFYMIVFSVLNGFFVEKILEVI